MQNINGRLALLSSLALAVTASSLPARADYLCKPLDVPGSTGTQLWQLNNAGQIAASSSLGGYIYSGGTWLPLPPPPASSGLVAADLVAFGINDFGVIAGSGSTATLAQRSFTLTGNSYNFFSYPGDPSGTEARAIANNGIVTGWQPFGFAWTYNPAAAPGYPPGFMQVVPTLPNGTRASYSIPGAMNAVGQFVGSTNFPKNGRHGFIYDPGKSTPITLFQINGTYTAARGINDNGAIVGFTFDTSVPVTPPATPPVVIFLLTARGYQLIKCPELQSTDGVYAESINNKDVITGGWFDAKGDVHGLVAYPNVVLPITSSNGSFVFNVAVSPNTPVFLDPEPAVGYQYAIGLGNPVFASVTLPIGIGDNIYTLIASDSREDETDAGERRAFTLPAGQTFDFTKNGFGAGVPAFEVLRIAPVANLDPSNPTAFVTEVTFGTGGNGRFTGTMTPMTAGDELSHLAKGARGSEGAGKLRRAQMSYAKGDVAGACKALAAFICETESRAQAAEAAAIENALSCPKAPACKRDD